MKKALLGLVSLYQHAVSNNKTLINLFFPGSGCRFFPSCSVYFYDSVDKYGILVGVVRGFWRIIRCNPFNKGGFDPVK